MKTYGRYTSAAVKAVKAANRLICNVRGEGGEQEILVCSGYWAFTMIPGEYDAVVRPVACCDPGNWELTGTGRKESDARFWDVLAGYGKNAAGTAQAVPMVFQNGKTPLSCFYSPAGGVAGTFDKSFTDSIAPGTDFRFSGKPATLVAYCADLPFACILPVKSSPEVTRTILAYFSDAQPAPAKCAAQEDGEVARLEAALEVSQQRCAGLEGQLEHMRQNLAAATEDKLQLRRKLEALETLEAPAKKLEAAPQNPGTTGAETVDSVVSRFTSIPGILATVKGAQTATPVVWLSGDVEAQADAIKQQGGKWSAKRSAYYFRVA